MGLEQLRPWLAARAALPVGPLFCIIDGPTRGRPWSAAAVRSEFRRLAAHAGVRRRFAPHQLRHAHALELAREGVPLNIIQRQRPGRIPPVRRPSGYPAPLRAAPAPPRPRRRARPRGRAAERDPAPARSRQPRHHQHLPAGNRHRGDHHGRAHAPRADDVRQRRAAALIRSLATTSGSATAFPLRPGEASASTTQLTRSNLVRSEHPTRRLGDVRLSGREQECAAGGAG